MRRLLVVIIHLMLVMFLTGCERKTTEYQKITSTETHAGSLHLKPVSAFALIKMLRGFRLISIDLPQQMVIEILIEDKQMVIGIALVVTFFSILGCIEIKKPVVREILGMVALINIMIVVLAAGFIYNSEYKIHDVADSTSQDGKYVLLFQQVGDPDWPFGHTHARLVLKDESGTIVKYSFDVLNDGGNVHPDLWQVTWKDNCVEAVISGEEQSDIQYILYFNGEKDSNQF